MQHAAAHASTMLDPQPLTSAASPSDHAHPPRSSQDSSLSQSSSSRPTTLNISTSDVSTAAISKVHHEEQEEYTPPTSAISSQLDSQGTRSPGLSEKKEHSVDGVGEDPSQKQRSTSRSQSPLPDSLSGTKRTASGQHKRSSVNGLADIVTQANGASHSRTSSMVSSGTSGNVLELSQQLRTKLKYAMIKVQNGWQTRSFDEVESLASQSPRSTISGFQHSPKTQTLLSPRSAMSRKYQRESSESDSSDSTVALESRGLVNMSGSPQVAARRALAPPIDILPSSSRRRRAPNGVHGPGVHARHMHISRPTTSQRTPSQNAAMEADAVETLLFMASPSNSGYNPSTHSSQESSLPRSVPFPISSQTSPLRNQFSQTSMTSPKKVAFSDGRPPIDKAALIDRILDELSDDSDDELEQAFRLAEKSKITASVST
ncbi:hypothetical protein EDD37DRAFT_6178 [Exophiala viscosa]|uniref:Uncharacterized protein n=1 Tax=Exophiala viscosa TaxID=2486360 RepID=A0AAN6I8Q7_9EURO|nr:hypothetical protein EDD36DRAFT_423846 [Exophiala viscosa]KAI1628433.1 hypothetical protein EDD37DRAFT_6178 [Exophiala viscosa]